MRAINLPSCFVWEAYEILRIQLAEVHDVQKSRSRYVHFWLVIKRTNTDSDTSLAIINEFIVIFVHVKVIILFDNSTVYGVHISCYCRHETVHCFDFVKEFVSNFGFNKLQVVDRFQSIFAHVDPCDCLVLTWEKCRASRAIMSLVETIIIYVMSMGPASQNFL